MNYFLILFIGYLFGCVQSSYWLGKWFRSVDIRELGHGNAGMSNAVASLGWKYGLVVGIIDIGKAVVSLWLVRILFNLSFPQDAFLLYLNGFAVLLGHIFPFYMRFKGGKGTASLVGVLLGLNLYFGLGGIITIVLITLFTDYIALGGIALNVYVLVAGFILKLSPPALILNVLALCFSVFLHRKNLKRIKHNTEGRLSLTFKKKQ